MAPSGVIPSLDVLEDGGRCLGPGVISVKMNFLGFERVEERFRAGIVVTVASTPHTLPCTAALEILAKRSTRVLLSAI